MEFKEKSNCIKDCVYIDVQNQTSIQFNAVQRLEIL